MQIDISFYVRAFLYKRLRYDKAFTDFRWFSIQFIYFLDTMDNMRILKIHFAPLFAVYLAIAVAKPYYTNIDWG